MRNILCLAFLVISLNAKATESFCETSEKALFSCMAGNKYVALCASNHISKNMGYVQYRVKSKGKLEFSYPSSKRSPNDVFFENYLTWAADEEQQVYFENGQYTYLIYDRSFKAGSKDASAGVFVFRNGKSIGGLSCNAPEDPFARAFTPSFERNLFQNKGFPY